jgi:TrmH family RNA methyltransferase
MITSRQHPFVQRCRQIAHGRGEPGEVLLDGLHLVNDAAAAGVPLLAAMATAEMADTLERAAPAAELRLVGSDAVMAAASPVRTPSGIVAIAAWQPAPIAAVLSRNIRVIVGLVGVQDPGNVGNLIRSADAFGADGVVLLDGSADAANWKTLRAAMGSTFRVPLARGTSTEALALARAHGLRLAAAVPAGGAPPWTIDPDGPVFVLIGSEGAGLPASLIGTADIKLTLPMRPGVDSLNAATTGAVLLWELGRAGRALAKDHS